VPGKIKKILKKLRENGNFYAKLFSTKSILVFGVILKKINIDTCNFHQGVGW